MGRQRTDQYGSSYNTVNGARKAPPFQSTGMAAAGTTSSSYFGSSYYNKYYNAPSRTTTTTTNTNVPSFATNTNVPSFATNNYVPSLTTTNRNMPSLMTTNRTVPSRTTNASTNARQGPSHTKKTTNLSPEEKLEVNYAGKVAYSKFVLGIDGNINLSMQEKMKAVKKVEFNFSKAQRYLSEKNNATEMQQLIDLANGGNGGGVADDATVATDWTAMDMSRGL